MTHYSNDYFDLAADRANFTPTRWSGGSRVLVQTTLPPRWALYLALTLLPFPWWRSPRRVARQAGRRPLVLGRRWLLLVLQRAAAAAAFAWRWRADGGHRGAGAVPSRVTRCRQERWRHCRCWRPLPLALFQFAMLLAIGFPDEVGDATPWGSVRWSCGWARRKRRGCGSAGAGAGRAVAASLLLGGVPARVVAWHGALQPAAGALVLVAYSTGCVGCSPLVELAGLSSASALLVGSAAVALVGFLSLSAWCYDGARSRRNVISVTGRCAQSQYAVRTASLRKQSRRYAMTLYAGGKADTSDLPVDASAQERMKTLIDT
jgi:hypothetical protein